MGNILAATIMKDQYLNANDGFKHAIRLYMAFAGGITAELVPYLMKHIDITDDIIHKDQYNIDELSRISYLIVMELTLRAKERAEILEVADADMKSAMSRQLMKLGLSIRTCDEVVDKVKARKLLLVDLLSLCRIMAEATSNEYPIELLEEGIK